MKQLPGPGDTNMCPGCRSLGRCSCGDVAPMKASDVPTFENELAYAVETFEDENDRKPNAEELKTLTAEAREKVDSAKEAYAEWKASGGFVCEMCDRVHYNWAPQDCRDAYNAERD